MRLIKAVSMWMSALMLTSHTTVALTQSALIQWDPLPAPVNPVLSSSDNNIKIYYSPLRV